MIYWSIIPNNRTLKYIKQNLTEMKGKIENLTIVVGNFNIVLYIMGKTIR